MTSQLGFHGSRLLLLGHRDAGKTSLQRALRLGPSAKDASQESTPVMECQTMLLGEGFKQKSVAVWDVGGDPKYMPALQPYIVEGSIYLLVVPAMDTLQLNVQYLNFVGRWLDMLEIGAPNAIVVPVITQCDTLLGERGDKTAAALENAASSHVTWLTEAIERHQRQTPEGSILGSRQLRFQFPVQCVTTVPGGENSLDALKARIEAVLFSDPPLLPSVGMIIPRAQAPRWSLCARCATSATRPTPRAPSTWAICRRRCRRSRRSCARRCRSPRWPSSTLPSLCLRSRSPPRARPRSPTCST